MGLFAALVLGFVQDPAVSAPSGSDRGVALSAPVARSTEESRPLALPPESRSAPLLDRPERGPSLGGFVFWSLVVVVLLVGAFVLFKRFTKNSRLFGSSAAIAVLARRALGARQEILLVEIGGKILILGTTRDRISTLGELADVDAVARVKGRLPESKDESSAGAFRDSLKKGLRDYEQGGDEPKKSRVEGVFEELAALKKTVSAWRA